jgi:predicted component of type VI protein secretion system
MQSAQESLEAQLREQIKPKMHHHRTGRRNNAVVVAFLRLFDLSEQARDNGPAENASDCSADAMRCSMGGLLGTGSW